jgi:hypothetical protein
VTTNTVELDDLEIRILEAMMFSTEPLPELKELDLRASAAQAARRSRAAGDTGLRVVPSTIRPDDG